MAKVAQESIRVEVDFFDQKERDKLLRYPSAKQMASGVRNGLHIPMPEFLTHLIWHRQRLGSQEYRDRAALTRKLDIAKSLVDGCVEFSGASIRMPSDTTTQLTEVSEHVGEAIGLSVVDRIHELNEADWKVLPQYG